MTDVSGEYIALILLLDSAGLMLGLLFGHRDEAYDLPKRQNYYELHDFTIKNTVFSNYKIYFCVLFYDAFGF